MNPAFLKYYSQELQHVREMGCEFAAAFPKIAGRLALAHTPMIGCARERNVVLGA